MKSALKKNRAAKKAKLEKSRQSQKLVDSLIDYLVCDLQDEVIERIWSDTLRLPTDLYRLRAAMASKLMRLMPRLLIPFLVRLKQQCTSEARIAKLRLQRLEDADDDRAQEEADYSARARSAVVAADEALAWARAMLPDIKRSIR
jgi:hypothetical protein